MTPSYSDPRYYLQSLLSRRDYSITRAKAKLEGRKFSPEQVKETIAWGKQKGWLNDESFAEKWITSTLRFKPVGPRWLKLKLKQQGIASSLIDQALRENYPPGQEGEYIRQAIKKWRRQQPQEKQTNDRLNRFLASRGFSLEEIRQAIEENQ